MWKNPVLTPDQEFALEFLGAVKQSNELYKYVYKFPDHFKTMLIVETNKVIFKRTNFFDTVNCTFQYDSIYMKTDEYWQVISEYIRIHMDWRPGSAYDFCFDGLQHILTSNLDTVDGVPVVVKKVPSAVSRNVSEVRIGDGLSLVSDNRVELFISCFVRKYGN